jgi:hypothetical protein
MAEGAHESSAPDRGNEVALLGEVGTQVRHDPLERSIEPTA